MTNMENYVVRKAVFEDLEGICRLLSESFIETKEPIRYWWRIMENKSIYTYVIESAGNVVGTATLHVLEKLIGGGSFVGQIEDVCVSKSHSGKGLGQMLVNQLIEISKEARCYKVILNCDEKLVPFYEKNGFYQKEIQMRLDNKK
jgi:glucosamine-phosphate N-acetyltransferase